jgi:hypothetical protein
VHPSPTAWPLLSLVLGAIALLARPLTKKKPKIGWQRLLPARHECTERGKAGSCCVSVGQRPTKLYAEQYMLDEPPSTTSDLACV